MENLLLIKAGTFDLRESVRRRVVRTIIKRDFSPDSLRTVQNKRAAAWHGRTALIQAGTCHTCPDGFTVKTCAKEKGLSDDSLQTVDKGSDLKDEVQSFFYAHDICDFVNNFIKNVGIPEYTGTFCPCFSL